MYQGRNQVSQGSVFKLSSFQDIIIFQNMLLRNPAGLLPYCPSDDDVGGDFDGGGQSHLYT